MDCPVITHLDSLIETFLQPDEKYLTCDIKPLTAAGENYGSFMVAIDIQVKKNQEEETIHAVAKLVPQSDFRKKFLNIHYTVPMELGFYQTILPVLKRFVNGRLQLDFFANFYAGRLSLDSSVNLDDSIIILENLKPQGYVLLDKMTGFNRNIAELVLSKMAVFHGSVLSLKEQDPNQFSITFKPFLKPFKVFEMEKEFFMTCQKLVTGIDTVIKEDEFCALHFNQIEAAIMRCVRNLDLPKNDDRFSQDNFATLSHCDLWVNNIMFKLTNGKVEGLKFIDWQLYEHISVIKDILFFLFTSVADLNDFDHLILFYYEKLKETLLALNSYNEKFSLDNFQNELKKISSSVGFFYVMMALPSIFPAEGHVWKSHELNEQRMLDQIKVSDFCRTKIHQITRIFIEKSLI